MSARARYAELTAESRQRELLVVAVIGLAIAAVASLIMGWQLGTAAGLWAAGGVLVYQWRVDRAASWAASEHHMTQLLAPLERHGYAILRDRSLPESLAHLDHLVVGPSGVIVVDSKNWRHKRIITGARDKFRIGRIPGRTAVRSAAFESDLVHEALSGEFGRPIPVHAVLAVHGARVPYWRSPAINGVPLVEARRVRHWILDRPEQFGAAEVARIAETAERIFPPYQSGI